MDLEYFASPFLLAWFLAMMASLWMIRVAHRYNVMDHPATAERKIHRKSTPLLGGVGIFVAFWIIVGLWAWQGELLEGFLTLKNLLGIFAAGCILMIGGVLDDKYDLSPVRQIAFPLVATLVVIASGIGIDSFAVPFWKTVDFTQWSTTVFTINDIPYRIVWLADSITFAWLMLMMYTTKFSDTIDGLVPGISGIAAFTIVFLSLSNIVAQPETAFLAAILAAVAIGFLLFNWHPAMIFLGESGSIWLGFMLGVLAILAGSKIVTTILVMGIPLLDLFWVVLRRVFVEKRNPAKGDRKHLAHRLLDIGFSQRRAVVFLYALATVFGLASLMVTREYKVWVVVGLLAVMVLMGVWLVLRTKQSALDEVP